jgi:hypothetical protein
MKIGERWPHGVAELSRLGRLFCARSSFDRSCPRKLRQHPWDPAVEWTGHSGGHYGNNEAAFLRAYVLPLLLGQ